MFLFRGTWIIIFLGLFFATTLTFANESEDGSGCDDDVDGSGSGSGCEYSQASNKRACSFINFQHFAPYARSYSPLFVY